MKLVISYFYKFLNILGRDLLLVVRLVGRSIFVGESRVE